MTAAHARTARRYECLYGNTGHVAHTSGSGTPTRKTCANCGGRLVTYEGLWGAFVWNADNRYPLDNARRTFTSDPAAQRYADANGLVVRWISGVPS